MPEVVGPGCRARGAAVKKASHGLLLAVLERQELAVHLLLVRVGEVQHLTTNNGGGGGDDDGDGDGNDGAGGGDDDDV